MHFKLRLSCPDDLNGFSLGRIDFVTSKLECSQDDEKLPRSYMVFVELTAVADFLRNCTVEGTPGRYQLPNGDVIAFKPSSHHVAFEVGGGTTNVPTDVVLKEIELLLGKSAEILSEANPLDPVLGDIMTLIRMRS